MAQFERRPDKDHLAAVYVHAGAGYHSTGNEHIHLQACANAAKMGMVVLKNGGSALDAVEITIRALEDNDVTNAGYGSNLNVDGTVECDATIVDHLGRSGAVGAMSNVRNPISVARIVYEESIKPMILRRVPPNLLTGLGATDFARRHGIKVLPNDFLISTGAKQRFCKWKNEIETAKEVENMSGEGDVHDTRVLSSELQDIREAVDKGAALSNNPTIAALANESQPFSPHPGSAYSPFIGPGTSETAPYNDSPGIRKSRRVNSHTTQAYAGIDSFKDPLDQSPSYQCKDNGERHFKASTIQNPSVASNVETGPATDRSPPANIHHSVSPVVYEDAVAGTNADEDRVADTVGAIAVDRMGNIAAASSSGGIGMKHRGRTGPAALVGIGTAVLPVDPEDHDEKTVACVTSGTGEHMATSMAANNCALRVLTGQKLGSQGELIEADEDNAMKTFVQKDFMSHPAIIASHSSGAIGAMLVKKTRDGMWLYWVHNTDSFALASMHADDLEPHTAMSRNRKRGHIATGARSMRPGTTTPKHGNPAGSQAAKRRRSGKTTRSRGKTGESATVNTSSMRLFTTPTKFRLPSMKTDTVGKPGDSGDQQDTNMN